MPKPASTRCALYDEDTQKRCRRNGTGSPPMCQRHREEMGAGASSSSPLGTIFDAVIHGRMPDTDTIRDAMFGVIEGALGRKLTAEEKAQAERFGGVSFDGDGSAGPSSSRSSSPPPPGAGSSARAAEQEARARAAAISRARKTLGFTAKEEITPASLKARYRELAKKWHPDRYTGDLAKQKVAAERMIAINAAMDTLGGRG